jgi:hypothetical protein
VTYDDSPQQEYLYTNHQLQRVFNAMKDQSWYTVQQVSSLVNGYETSVSSSMRDLRKAKNGGHTVERRRVDGTYQYRLLVNSTTNEKVEAK